MSLKSFSPGLESQAPPANAAASTRMIKLFIPAILPRRAPHAIGVHPTNERLAAPQREAHPSALTAFFPIPILPDSHFGDLMFKQTKKVRKAAPAKTSKKAPP